MSSAGQKETTWFLAIYHLAQSNGGISSIELGRRLGAHQATAWLMKHKLMQAMAMREATKTKLGGRVEMDDAYLDGQRPRRPTWPRRSGQDAFRGRGRDDGRSSAAAAQAYRWRVLARSFRRPEPRLESACGPYTTPTKASDPSKKQ